MSTTMLVPNLPSMSTRSTVQRPLSTNGLAMLPVPSKSESNLGIFISAAIFVPRAAGKNTTGIYEEVGFHNTLNGVDVVKDDRSQHHIAMCPVQNLRLEYDRPMFSLQIPDTCQLKR